MHQTFSGLLRLLGPGLAELLAGREIILENVELDLAELELTIPVGGSTVYLPGHSAGAIQPHDLPVNDRTKWPEKLLNAPFTPLAGYISCQYQGSHTRSYKRTGREQGKDSNSWRQPDSFFR